MKLKRNDKKIKRKQSSSNKNIFPIVKLKITVKQVNLKLNRKNESMKSLNFFSFVFKIQQKVDLKAIKTNGQKCS